MFCFQDVYINLNFIINFVILQTFVNYALGPLKYFIICLTVKFSLFPFIYIIRSHLYLSFKFVSNLSKLIFDTYNTSTSAYYLKKKKKSTRLY